MKPGTVRASAARELVEAALCGELTEGQARRLYSLGPEAVTLALLSASKPIAEQDGLIASLRRQRETQQPSPSTPSGRVPVYAKPNAPKRRKKPGAKEGHPGHRRKAPARIDQRRTHRLKRCPCCGGPLQRCERTRTRVIEDIPEEIEPVVTEHTIHRDYCPKCKRHVEPVMPDALPRAMLGHYRIALTAWLHYGLGVTIDQIIDILSYHLQTELTAGG